MGIAENIEFIRNEIPKNVSIVAVSKTMTGEKIMEAYRAGQRIFGENKVQEMVDKQKILPTDIQWHLIGHLQTNKVRYIISFVSLIHSVDSINLLDVINAEAAKQGRVVDCLLQIKIASEETKFGMKMDEAKLLLDSANFKKYKNVRITGLMGMATFTNNTDQLRKEFDNLAFFYKEIKRIWFANCPLFKELSMGMSGDYKIAIEAGATLVRIGSLIFGERIYSKQ
jgi:pyridoxal phosphate enzyme (YggS family)